MLFVNRKSAQDQYVQCGGISTKVDVQGKSADAGKEAGNGNHSITDHLGGCVLEEARGAVLACCLFIGL